MTDTERKEVEIKPCPYSTPRPWQWVIDKNGNYYITAEYGKSKYGETFFICTYLGMTPAEKEANAKLIVCAVNRDHVFEEMVDVLKSLVNNYRGNLSAFGEEMRDIVGNTNIAVAEHWLKNAEQVLFKASKLTEERT